MESDNEQEYKIVINDDPSFLSPSSPLSDAHFIYEKPYEKQKNIKDEEFPPIDEKLDQIAINPMFSTKEIKKR